MRRRNDVCNVRVPDAAWGMFMRGAVRMRMLQAQCEGKTQHKLVVEAMRSQILVRATAERLDKLVMSSVRGCAVVRRTPCSLGIFLVKFFHKGHAEVILVRCSR